MKTEMFRPEIELFNDSLARCLRRGELFQRFYELFLASSDEVREKFRATDFRRQRRMLQTSFYMLVECIALGWPECEAYLERIAVAHGKHGRDIAPHLYDLWLRPRTARGGAGKPAPPPGAAAARAGILPACWKPK